MTRGDFFEGFMENSYKYTVAGHTFCISLPEGGAFSTVVAFSASATGPEYCVGLMYADTDADLTEPSNWTKLDRPLLTSCDLDGEYGPGHNSFVNDENGDWIFVYHSRDEVCFCGECGFADCDPLYDPCRSARKRKVFWDENDFPILNG